MRRGGRLVGSEGWWEEEEERRRAIRPNPDSGKSKNKKVNKRVNK